MLVENFDVEANALFGGKGIHVATNGVYLPGNLFRAAVLGPLKDHVLQKMRNPIGLRLLVARPGPHPDSDRHRTDMRHGFAQNSQSVGQDFSMNIARLVYHSLPALIACSSPLLLNLHQLQVCIVKTV